MRRALWVLAVFCVCMGRAEAQNWTGSLDGNDLHKYCRQGAGAARAFCLGYVTGVVNALKGETHFCISTGAAQMDRLADIVEAHLRDHPEEGHDPAAELVKRALGEKYPCD